MFRFIINTCYRNQCSIGPRSCVTAQTIFSIGLWLIGYYLVLRGATHFQVFVTYTHSIARDRAKLPLRVS
jgi:hypothetical protein